jgi:sulfur-carrier protein adenylyltransferase/sulfurtransferase
MKISRTYFILASLLAGLAFILVLLPKTTRNKEIQPEVLLNEIIDPARFVNPDYIAERLINEDPSLLLIDVRTPDYFSKFSLPGAINIPFSVIGNEDWESDLNQKEKDMVLFSNDDIFADQAWIICTRMGYKNLYVMKGGLNKWYTDILSPTEPSETAPKEEFELYSFRKAASQYFTGASAIVEKGTTGNNLTVKKKAKKGATIGGC